MGGFSGGVQIRLSIPQSCDIQLERSTAKKVMMVRKEVTTSLTEMGAY